ncbi:phosphoribosylformylglycinamidine synthase subunit PurS [Terribacillus goriensis]|uniref:phosphoribosylformylglycinamidine synthase subunit PurS n=1 Tax=Terribacillus saccharophilus TaxID=361277 RepID=UPI0039835A79
MKKIKIFITLKEGVLDPQGKAVQEALQANGFPDVADTRVGKYIEMTLPDEADVALEVQRMCDKLLANPVMEEYSYTVEEGINS